jgi:O-antigen/teichoic acid export membrane protein
MHQSLSPLSILSIAQKLIVSVSSGTKRESLLSLVDQTVVSGTAFLTTVLLGRWCGAEQLGVYALGFTIVVLMTNAQGALVTIPYTNQWRTRPQADRAGFAGGALIQQIAFAALMSGALGILGVLLLLFGLHGKINTAVLVVGVVLPLLLLREFARRFAFAHLRVGTACCIDLVVSVAQIAGIIVIFFADRLDATTAFIATGIAASIGGSMGLAKMRRSFSLRLDLLAPSIREHWRFGRWVLASSLLITIQTYFVHWLLAFISGTADTGVYSACLTSVRVLNPLLLGIGNVSGPLAARAFADGGLNRLRSLIGKVSSCLIPVLGLYCILVHAVGDQVIAFLYRGNEYLGHGHLLTVFALTVFVAAFDLPIDAGLSAMNRPDIGFRASVVSTLVVVVGSCLLIPKYGMLGGAYAGLLGQSCGVVLRVLAFYRFLRTASG